MRADEFVLVHDAARPNLSLADLGRLLEVGRADPVGAILAAPVRDTLKRAGDDGGIDGTEPRERLWRALTPQLFRRHQLSRALSEAACCVGNASTTPRSISGFFQIRSVASVIMPKAPSPPIIRSRIDGPTERRATGRTSSGAPSGSTAFKPATMSSIFP